MKQKITKLFYLIIAFIFVFIDASAQSEISGIVIDEEGKPVQYANVIVLSRPDSVFVFGTTTDVDGRFVLNGMKDGIIQVRCIGYESSFVNQWTGNRTIKIVQNAVELNEVSVTSTLPITRLEKDALVTNVKGTILENVGSARDVLGRLPSIITSTGSVSVFGKGAPAIYINGQLVRNDNLLDQLQSAKIKKVELIVNPGARYDATVSSVIRISVERAPGEGISINEKATLNYRDYPSLINQTDVNYRHNNFDIFTVLEYDYNKAKGSSTNVQDSHFKHHSVQNIDMYSKTRQSLYDGKIGFNYTLPSNHIFGAFYQISHKPIKTKSMLDSESWMDNLLEEAGNVEKNVASKETDHLLEGYYTGTFGKWELTANADMLWKKSDNEEHSNESHKVSGGRSVNIDDNSRAHLYAGEAHLSHPLWKGNVNFGVEYTNSLRSEKSVNKEHIINDNDDEIHEYNTAAYVETSQRLGRVNIQVGLRYEHVESSYYEMGKKMNEQSRVYDNIFPSATIVLPIKKTIFQLSYTRKYDRPLYSQLSGTVSYVNRYLYQSGNPFLKSQYNDNLSLNFRYNWLILMATYTHTDGKIIDECMHYGDDESITLLRKENSSNPLHKFQLMAVAAPHFGNYHPNLMVGVVAQSFRISYFGNAMEFNKPMPIVRWNNMIQFRHGYLVNFDLNWRGSGDSENIRLGHVWSVNAASSRQFGKHWNLKISVNDIFNTSRKNNLVIWSGNSRLEMSRYSTSRNIECTIRYNFNATKSKYIGKGAGETEKNRL